jgi:hypothetical protein
MDTCSQSKKFPVQCRLYFNHIPRTAGTSVRIWLNSFFDATSACPYLHRHEFRQAPEEELRSYRFFSGHLQDLPLTLFGGELPVVTILREPRAHFASLITYYAQSWLCPPGSPPELVKEKSLEVLHEHAHQDYAPAWPAVNHQTKWLNNFDPKGARAATNADLQEAMRVLESALVVATVDRLQDFADLVCFKMRWPYRALDHRLNASPSSDLLQAVEPGHLASLLDLDDRLYEAAGLKLDQELRECFGSCADSVERAAILREQSLSAAG